jgi:hypothetical protein
MSEGTYRHSRSLSPMLPQAFPTFLLEDGDIYAVPLPDNEHGLSRVRRVGEPKRRNDPRVMALLDVVASFSLRPRQVSAYAVGRLESFADEIDEALAEPATTWREDCVRDVADDACRALAALDGFDFRGRSRASPTAASWARPSRLHVRVERHRRFSSARSRRPFSQVRRSFPDGPERPRMVSTVEPVTSRAQASPSA